MRGSQCGGSRRANPLAASSIRSPFKSLNASAKCAPAISRGGQVCGPLRRWPPTRTFARHSTPMPTPKNTKTRNAK